MANHVDIKLSSSTQPLFCYFSDPVDMKYRYCRTTICGNKMTEELLYLQEIAAELLKSTFNIVIKPNIAFVNFYKDGTKFLPPHKDKTHAKYPIVSFSFYEDDTKEDDLRILAIHDKDQIKMEHCSVIIMQDGEIMHSVPKSDTQKYRINVTFRVSD
jgi:alkylated DNA repair dioxygenase AlkB